MADESLNAFLSEGTSAATASTQEAAPEAKTDAAPAADKPPVESPGALPAPAQQAAQDDEDSDRSPIPYNRFKTVNDKKRDLERENAELRGRLSVHERPQVQTPQQVIPETPKPSIEDRFFTEGPKLFEETRDGLRSEIVAAKKELKYELSEAAVRAAHPDFDAKRQVFEQELRARDQAGDQSLLMRFRAAPDPARFIVNEAAMIEEMRGIESPAQYRAKVEAEVRASVEEKVRKELALERAGNASTTNAGARGTGVTAAPVAPRDIPDKEIFRGAMR
jgi:hypothetical protein